MLDDIVGPIVVEGIEEGDGLGFGEAVGDTLGSVVQVGAPDAATLGLNDGKGVGAGELDGLLVGYNDTVGKVVGTISVGYGEGFGEDVGTTDGKSVVGLDDGEGLGTGELVGSRVGAVERSEPLWWVLAMEYLKRKEPMKARVLVWDSQWESMRARALSGSGKVLEKGWDLWLDEMLGPVWRMGQTWLGWMKESV